MAATITLPTFTPSFGARPLREETKSEVPEGRPIEPGKGVLRAALGAIQWLDAHRQPDTVADWVESVSGLNGRIVLSGMGKSGLVAQKISATFASTGSPSFFMHPAEALHGDLGMVAPGDSVLLLSNSGESEEILKILPSLSRFGIPIAAITSRIESSLGQSARWCFSYQLPDGEGCPIDMAPMASTTVQLVIGDVLAASLMAHRGFTEDHFAELHPGGSLGTRLLKIKDLMHFQFPKVATSASLIETLQTISTGKLGMTTVFENEYLIGVISDGDIRRALEYSQARALNPLDLKAGGILSGHPPHTIDANSLATEAARVMESRKITFLVATSDDKPTGIIHIHDLLAAKVI